MDKKPVHRLPCYILIAFSLCLCNLVLHELVADLGYCLPCGNARNLAERGGVPEAAHIHDNEDHFVLAETTAPQLRVGIVCEASTICFEVHSCSPSPLLPPPKTA
jgi:hypothetical protein